MKQANSWGIRERGVTGNLIHPNWQGPLMALIPVVGLMYGAPELRPWSGEFIQSIQNISNEADALGKTFNTMAGLWIPASLYAGMIAHNVAENTWRRVANAYKTRDTMRGLVQDNTRFITKFVGGTALTGLILGSTYFFGGDMVKGFVEENSGTAAIASVVVLISSIILQTVLNYEEIKSRTLLKVMSRETWRNWGLGLIPAAAIAITLQVQQELFNGIDLSNMVSRLALAGIITSSLVLAKIFGDSVIGFSRETLYKFMRIPIGVSQQKPPTTATQQQPSVDADELQRKIAEALKQTKK